MAEDAKRYMLFAYKPNADDYCRGCHVASYSSDLFFETDLTEEQVIEKLSLIQAHECDTGEAGYEQIYVYEAPAELSAEVAERVYAAATAGAEQIRRNREAERKRAQELKAERQKKESEERERREYEALKAKFEKKA